MARNTTHDGRRTTNTRLCPNHPTEPRYLPLSVFGLNRSRPDGLNRYCRECNRARRARVRAAGPVLRPKSFSRQEAQKADGRYLVLWALRHGARTQREMRRLIRMHLVVSGHESLSDVITDGLAELMLDERVVRCVGFAGGERAYALEFLKAS